MNQTQERQLYSLLIDPTEFGICEHMSEVCLDKFIASKAERIGAAHGWPSWMRASPEVAAGFLPQPSRAEDRRLAEGREDDKRVEALEALAEAGVALMPGVYLDITDLHVPAVDQDESWRAGFEMAEAVSGTDALRAAGVTLKNNARGYNADQVTGRQALADAGGAKR